MHLITLIHIYRHTHSNTKDVSALHSNQSKHYHHHILYSPTSIDTQIHRHCTYSPYRWRSFVLLRIDNVAPIPYNPLANITCAHIRTRHHYFLLFEVITKPSLLSLSLSLIIIITIIDGMTLNNLLSVHHHTCIVASITTSILQLT